MLLSPLDWGLGHAARCIPLIGSFLNQGSEVTVFASIQLIGFLRIRFPDINYIEDKTPSFSYGLNGTDFFRLAGMALRMKRAVRAENKICEEICVQDKYDLVVSDNRYGFRYNGIKSVLITHQLQPIPPPFLRFGNQVMKRFLSNIYKSFQEVWVPDFSAFPGLGGRLSHPEPAIPGVRYLGPLSRFSEFPAAKTQPDPYSVLILTSGPAKHRNEMAEKLSDIFSNKDCRISVAGTELNNRSDIRCFESPSDIELLTLIRESGIIVSHSGYSTVMDLFEAGRSAILFPTRGQTEQQYLAQLHSDSFVVAKRFNDIAAIAEDHNKLISTLVAKEDILLRRKNIQMINLR